jgi:hypothetical protein
MQSDRRAMPANHPKLTTRRLRGMAACRRRRECQRESAGGGVIFVIYKAMASSGTFHMGLKRAVGA